MPEPLLKVLLLHPTQHSRLMASDGEDTAAKAEKSDLILLAGWTGKGEVKSNLFLTSVATPKALECFV